jgi:hypothetical protein
MDKNIIGNVTKILEAVCFLSKILTLHSLRDLSPIVTQVKAPIRAQNPNLSDFEAQDLREPAPIEEEWAWRRSQFPASDSAGFRESLPLLTTALSCGFGMSALTWLREKLQIYTLKCI